MIAMRAVPAWGLRPLLQRRDCSAFPPLHLIRLTNSSTMWQSIPIGPGLTVVGSSNLLRSTLTVEGLQEQLEGIAADEAESTAEAAKFRKLEGEDGGGEAPRHGVADYQIWARFGQPPITQISLEDFVKIHPKSA